MAETVVVFGATGFVGRNLVARFAKSGWRVIGVSRSGGPVEGASETASMSELAAIPTLPKDTVVVSVAAERYDAGRFERAQSDILMANVAIVDTVYDFCLQRGLREVRAASSVAVYEAGLATLDDRKPINLNASPNPNESFYAWSKRWGEIVAELYRARFDISTVSFRLSNPYGPHDSTDPARAHVAPAFVMRALAPGESFVIKGSPNVERDFIYIDDVCDVFEISLGWRGRTAAMNLCSGRTNTLGELAKEVLEALGDARPIVAGDDTITGVAARRSINDTVVGATGKTKFATLAEGLPPTLAWYANALSRSGG